MFTRLCLVGVGFLLGVLASNYKTVHTFFMPPMPVLSCNECEVLGKFLESNILEEKLNQQKTCSDSRRRYDSNDTGDDPHCRIEFNNPPQGSKQEEIQSRMISSAIDNTLIPCIVLSLGWMMLYVPNS